MSRSKSSLIGEIIERELRDAINSVIAECIGENQDAGTAKIIRNKRDAICYALRYRVERQYVVLEIIDSASWHKRKVGKETL